jgi:hypothetical protein
MKEKKTPVILNLMPFHSFTKRIYVLRTAPPPPPDGANPLQGPLEGVGPENRDSFLEINSNM